MGSSRGCPALRQNPYRITRAIRYHTVWVFVEQTGPPGPRPKPHCMSDTDTGGVSGEQTGPSVIGPSEHNHAHGPAKKSSVEPSAIHAHGVRGPPGPDERRHNSTHAHGVRGFPGHLNTTLWPGIQSNTNPLVSAEGFRRLGGNARPHGHGGTHYSRAGERAPLCNSSDLYNHQNRTQKITEDYTCFHMFPDKYLLTCVSDPYRHQNVSAEHALLDALKTCGIFCNLHTNSRNS